MSVNSANKAGRDGIVRALERRAGHSDLPASKYITPVTKTALICRWQIPKAPISAADPNIIKQTSAQDIDKFCIPDWL